MKKITLIVLLILSCTISSAQCIRTNLYGTIVSNNSGNFQTIVPCAFSSSDFSEISGLISGGNYIFTAQVGSVVGAGSPIYITITDVSNAVIQHGPSPLTVNGISATTVRVHYSNNAACGGSSSCTNSQVKYVTNCIVPLGLTSSSITTTTAIINWTAPTPAPADGYDYYVSTTNTAPAAVPTGTVTTGTSVSLSSLAIGTNYYIWVRSKCGANNTPWSASYNFATVCNPGSNFTEGFEASVISGVMPACWIRKIVSGSAGPNVYVINNNANTGSRSLVMANFSVAAATLYAVTPALTDLPAQNHRLKFYVKGNAPVTFTVGTMTDPANDATFTPKQVITLTTGYQQYVISFNTPTAASFIAFKAAYSSTNSTVNIDDVIWEPIPACLEASGVNVSSITGTTATLSWIASPSAPAQGYEYYLSASNTPPTSTTVATGSVISGTLANLTGLQSLSTYYVWVRSNCGTDKSPWTNTTTFMTGCPAFFVPNYTQDFASFVPVCWAVAGAGTPATGPTGTAPGIWEQSGFLNSIFTGAIKANLYSKDRIGWIVSPVIDLSAGGYRVKFDAAVSAHGTDTPSAMGSDDQVIFLISDNNGINWTALQTFNAANPLSNLKTTILTALTTHNSATTKFAFYATEGTVSDTQDYDFFIDNFIVEVTVCDVPDNVSVSALTTSSVNISWPAITGAAGYEYVLDNVITDPTGAGTATTVASYSGTGLTPLTSYYFHVRTRCGGTFSAWTTINFATPTVAPSNDECTGAVALTIGGAYADYVTDGTNLGATTSAQPAPTTCPGFSGGDIWFTAVVPANGSITIETGDSTTGAGLSTVITTYTGSCSALTEVGCDDGGSTGGYAKLALTGQAPGATLYIRAYQYYSDGSNSYGVFGISAYNSDFLNNPSFNAANFKAYPNPVKDFLNLSYTQDISNVTIFNLLGQQVLAKKVNASKSRIDMSGICAGTYFVKVTINNQVNIIKVIKQ
jgi:hypothetical protein